MPSTHDEDLRLPDLDETMQNPARGTKFILGACARLSRLLARSQRECEDGLCLWHRFDPETYGAIGGCEIDIRYAAEATAREIRELVAELAEATKASISWRIPDEALYHRLMAALAKADEWLKENPCPSK